MRVCQPLENGKLDPKYPFAMVVDQRDPLYWKIFMPVDPKDPMLRWSGHAGLTGGSDIYTYQVVELMAGRPVPKFKYWPTKYPEMPDLEKTTLAPVCRAHAMIFFPTMAELLYFRTKIR